LCPLFIGANFGCRKFYNHQAIPPATGSMPLGFPVFGGNFETQTHGSPLLDNM